MKNTCFIFAILIGILLLITTAFGDNSIGVNYAQVVDDRNWGLTGEWEQTYPLATLSVDGTLQSGDLYRGNVTVGLTFDIASIGVRLESANALKGYTLGTLGRQNTLHTDLVVPINNLAFAVGIFGRNGSPFAKASALDTLLSLGFNEDALLTIDAGNLYPEDRGITLPDGSAIGASVKGSFAVNRFTVDLKALLDLASTDTKVQQVHTDISTNGTLPGGLQWRWVAGIASQLYDGTLEYEIGQQLFITYTF